MRQGVLYLRDKNTDVFLITLNKAEKDFMPSTLYADYAVNESLFHWQSQSTTAPESPTGQRCIHHKERGDKVLLFVREFKQDGFGAAPFVFLGDAEYVSHSGSRPMDINWRLRSKIPAKFLRKVMQLMG